VQQQQQQPAVGGLRETLNILHMYILL